MTSRNKVSEIRNSEIAEIDDVPSSFKAEETEDLTPSPKQQKINDQPISKVGVNFQELSKAVEIEIRYM